MTVIYDSNDQMSKEFLRSNFKDSITFIDIGVPDSDYISFQPATKDCKNVIYLQNYFTVNAEDILKKAKQVTEYSAAFTRNAYTK